MSFLSPQRTKIRGISMSAISVSEGRICIIKVSELTSVKEGLDQIRNALIDFTTSDKVQDSKFDTWCLFGKPAMTP